MGNDTISRDKLLKANTVGLTLNCHVMLNKMEDKKNEETLSHDRLQHHGDLMQSRLRAMNKGGGGAEWITAVQVCQYVCVSIHCQFESVIGRLSQSFHSSNSLKCQQ